ncbi:MAG: alpha-amylase family glycosyl hydrolase, partial [Planctomycetota bacterium]
FAPESAYSTGKKPGCQVAEFKTMVRKLHQAGIEVILDVVYNHTAEGNELGPTLSLRGIDNRTYYCLTGGPSDPGRYYANYTGCGNSLNLTNPAVIRLVMDSLRYWAETMHVDG